MSGQRHPDATALAEYRAGLAGGHRGRRLAAHVASCARCAVVSDQLAAVSSALASAPAPPLPDAVERRITAALATEAAPATRAASTSVSTAPEGAAPEGTRGTGQQTSKRGIRWLRLAALSTGRAGSGRGIRLLSPVVVASATAACLVLFGLAYLLVLAHPAARPVSSSAAGSAASAPAAVGVPSPAAGNSLVPPARAAKAVFLVTASGTRYQRATLAAQVRAELAAKSVSERLRGASRPAGASSVPSAALTACVLHVTGGVSPTLVDRATYQGKAAYVIAVPHRAWVVGPDCTAGNPDVITSTGL